MTRIGTTFTSHGHGAEESLAAASLAELLEERWLDRWRHARTASPAYPPAWRDAASASETVWWVTPDELASLHEQVQALAIRYVDRLADPSTRPSGAEPIEFVALTFPFRAPAGS